MSKTEKKIGKGKNSLEDFNFDDFDSLAGMDDYDFESPDKAINTKNRSPISSIAHGALSGIDPRNGTADFVKTLGFAILPKSYDIAGRELNNLRYEVSGLVGDAKKEFAPVTTSLKKLARENLGLTDKILPKSIAEKVKSFSEEESSYSAPSQDQNDQAELTASLNGIFAAQQANADYQNKKDDVVTAGQRKVDAKRFKLSTNLQGHMAENIAKLVAYQDTVLDKYYRKSLELQHKQFFVSRELLNVTRLSTQNMATELAVISKNTALPNEVKVKKSEIFANTTATKIIGSIQDRTRNSLGHLTRNLRRGLVEQASGFASGMTGAFDQLGSLNEMSAMGADMGVDMNTLVGNMAGEGLRNSAAKAAGMKFGARGIDLLGKINPKLPGNIKSFGHRAENFLTDLPGFLVRKMKDSNGEGIWGGLSNLLGNDFEVGDRINHNLARDATEPVPWDILSRRTIIEIIPGFLSRTLEKISHIYDFISGGKKSDRLVFSPQREEFVPLKTQVQDVDRAIRGTFSSSVPNEINEILDYVTKKGGKISKEDRITLGLQLTQNARANINFDPRDYADETKLHSDIRNRTKVAKAFRKAFKLEEDPMSGNLKLSNDEEVSETHKKLASRFNTMRYGLDQGGETQNIINQQYALGGLEYLKMNGVAKRGLHGGIDSDYRDKYMREFLAADDKAKFYDPYGSSDFSVEYIIIKGNRSPINSIYANPYSSSGKYYPDLLIGINTNYYPLSLSQKKELEGYKTSDPKRYKQALQNIVNTRPAASPALIDYAKTGGSKAELDKELDAAVKKHNGGTIPTFGGGKAQTRSTLGFSEVNEATPDVEEEEPMRRPSFTTPAVSNVKVDTSDMTRILSKYLKESSSSEDVIEERANRQEEHASRQEELLERIAVGVENIKYVGNKNTTFTEGGESDDGKHTILGHLIRTPKYLASGAGKLMKNQYSLFKKLAPLRRFNGKIGRKGLGLLGGLGLDLGALGFGLAKGATWGLGNSIYQGAVRAPGAIARNTRMVGSVAKWGYNKMLRGKTTAIGKGIKWIGGIPFRFVGNQLVKVPGNLLKLPGTFKTGIGIAGKAVGGILGSGGGLGGLANRIGDWGLNNRAENRRGIGSRIWGGGKNAMGWVGGKGSSAMGWMGNKLSSIRGPKKVELDEDGNPIVKESMFDKLKSFGSDLKHKVTGIEGQGFRHKLSSAKNRLLDTIGGIGEDIYVKSDMDTPRLTFTKILNGDYFVVKTGKIVRHLKDIKSPIADEHGIVIDQKDLMLGLCYKDGRSISNKLTDVYGFLKTKTPSTFKEMFNKDSKLMSTLKKAYQKTHVVKDVYLKGYLPPDFPPVIKASTLSSGGYIDAKSKKIIHSVLEIRGEVVDGGGNIVLSNADLKNLVYANGKPVKGLHLLPGALNFGKNLLKGFKLLDKTPLGAVKSTIGFFSDKMAKRDDKVVEVLNKIYKQILKMSPTVDRETAEANREGGVNDLINKRKARRERKGKGATEGNTPAGAASAAMGGFVGPMQPNEHHDPKDEENDSPTEKVWNAAKGIWEFASESAVAAYAGKKLLQGRGIATRAITGLSGQAANIATTARTALAGASAAEVGGGAAIAAADGMGAITGISAMVGGAVANLNLPALLVGLEVANYKLDMWYKKKIKYTDKMKAFTLLRMLQYGIPVNNISAVIAVRTFEDEIAEYIVVPNSKAASCSLRDDEVWDKYAELFGNTKDDKVVKESFLKWYAYRFKPVYIKHKRKANYFDLKLDDVDEKLKDENVIDYVVGVQFGSEDSMRGNNPYSIGSSPWKDIALADNSDFIKTLSEQLKNNAKRGLDETLKNTDSIKATKPFFLAKPDRKKEKKLDPNYDKVVQERAEKIANADQRTLGQKLLDYGKIGWEDLKYGLSNVKSLAKQTYDFGKEKIKKAGNWVATNVVTPIKNSLAGMIAAAESGGKGYNAYNRGTAGNKILGPLGPKNLESMTLTEILAAQQKPINDPDRLFAVGKYQMIPKTLLGAIKTLGINPDTTYYSKDVQEALFASYLLDAKRPEIASYIKGKSDDVNKAMLGAAKEWASLPDPTTGVSRYGNGNKASVSTTQLAAALQQSRNMYATYLKSGLSEDEAFQRATSTDMSMAAPSKDAPKSESTDAQPLNIGGTSSGAPYNPAASASPSLASMVRPSTTSTMPQTNSSNTTTSPDSVLTPTAENTAPPVDLTPISDTTVKVAKDAAGQRDQLYLETKRTNDLLQKLLEKNINVNMTPANNSDAKQPIMVNTQSRTAPSAPEPVINLQKNNFKQPMVAGSRY